MTAVDVAVIGTDPASIYASDILSGSGLGVNIDLFEHLPTPYDLIRYSVAPDHSRIKQTIVMLYKILQHGDIRLLGDVEVGHDTTIEDLHDRYDAVIIATGADRDTPLDTPGVELPKPCGTADFVSWYNGNPDYPRTWPLRAKSVAVVGVSNVALDVARVLAKHAEGMITIEVPQNATEDLTESPIADVHAFSRHDPAQVKFASLELCEFGKIPDVDVIVDEENFDFDRGSKKALRESNQQCQVIETLTNCASVDSEEHTTSRRVRIRLFQSPMEILADEKGHVKAFHIGCTELIEDDSVHGTGLITARPIEAVYRAVDYASSPTPSLPFDEERHVMPSIEGHIMPSPDSPFEDAPLGVYATGWIKHGPAGLIGLTKSNTQQTIAHLVEDTNEGRLHAGTSEVGHETMVALLEECGVKYTTWQGWELLDAYKRQPGEEYGELPEGRGVHKRVKAVSRRVMIDISRGCGTGADLIGEMGEMGVPSAPERFEDYSDPGRRF